ncbi:MAG: hypothetical protein Q8R92_08720, partial [Deltaproteobacteria bacterium]|nr:hypothetical protein [Deltaproteobacteria bacterium]
ENCFACHSRLPSSKQFNLGENFLGDAEMKRLPLEEQVRLAVATRQFDTALATCEKILRSTDIPASEIDLMGTFEDYLKITIRVQTDYTRAIAALGQFAKRPDVHPYLEANIQSWIEALDELGSAPLKGDEFGRGKKLIKRGQLRNRFPADRRGLVYFVAASGLLHRHVDQNAEKGRALAEPYYLLGVAESYIGNSFWVSETEFFLETSIRIAPDAPIAGQAYEFLEEFTIQEFTGSSGVDLPDDVRMQLKELRELIENAAAPQEAGAPPRLA